MNLTIFKQTIKEKCDFLISEGYKIEYYGNRHMNFRKKEGNYSNQITFQITKYGELYILDALSCEKRFNDFEEFILPLTKDTLDRLYTITGSSNIEDIPKALPFEKYTKNTSFQITTKAELELYLDFVKIFYEKRALPFFQHYNTIEKVNNELVQLLDKKNLQSLICGPEVIERVYIISLLCKNTEMLKFFEETYIPHMTKQTNPNFIKKLNNILTLKEEFEKGNISMSPAPQ